MKRFDWRVMEQLSLGLDVEDEMEAEGFSSPAEAQVRSEMARRVLEARWELDGEDAPDWLYFYYQLLMRGFGWRKAVYIAWAASPKQGRWPETTEKLATECLGLSSPRVIYTWRKKDARIDDAITMMQSAPLWEHRADFYRAMIAVGTSEDYKGFNDRKLALELLGDYVPRSKLGLDVGGMAEDMSQLSDAELDLLMGKPAEIEDE